MKNRTKKNINEEVWEENEKGLLLPKNLILQKGDNKKEKRSLVDYIKWGINHISVLVLFPSIVGAIWQIIELAKINIAYIRFFSLSQIPVDGALILFLSGLLLLIGKLTIDFIKFSSKQRVKNFEDEEYMNSVKSKINCKLGLKGIVSLMLIIMLIYSLTGLYSAMFSSSPIITLIFVFMSIAAVAIYVIELIPLVIIKIKLSYPDEVGVEEFTDDLLQRTKKVLTWIILPSIGLIIFMLFTLLKLFSQSFVLPDDLYNIKKLDSAVYDDFNTKNYVVEYFNDKYIFVKLCTIDKCNHDLDKEIVIYPMEKVLFDKSGSNN